MSGFEKMIYTCLLWVVAYLVTLFITHQTGVGSNVLKHAIKRLSKLRKRCDNFRDILTAPSFSIKSKKGVIALSEIVRYQNGIVRILNLYLYDDKNDKDVKDAKEYVLSVSDYCRKALTLAIEGTSSDINDFFRQVDTRISSAEALLKKAMEYDIKSEMLKV